MRKQGMYLDNCKKLFVRKHMFRRNLGGHSGRFDCVEIMQHGSFGMMRLAWRGSREQVRVSVTPSTSTNPSLGRNGATTIEVNAHRYHSTQHHDIQGFGAMTDSALQLPLLLPL